MMTLATTDAPTTALAHAGDLSVVQFDREKVDLLKRTICKGATNDELELFIHACNRLGLDPFMRQIHAVKRKQKGDDGQWREAMTIQTGIDGYRLIAERTGKYMPGPKPTYEHDDGGQLVCATAYVKKLGPDSQWHTIEADAFFGEYASFRQDGMPTRMWADKPHVMLAKCAESLALRRAFPAELSGVYTAEEMEQNEGRRPVTSRATAAPTFDDDNYFLSKWDEQSDAHTLDRDTGRQVLRAKLGRTAFCDADVSFREKLLGDYRNATVQQIEQVKQRAKAAEPHAASPGGTNAPASTTAGPATAAPATIDAGAQEDDEALALSLGQEWENVYPILKDAAREFIGLSKNADLQLLISKTLGTNPSKSSVDDRVRLYKEIRSRTINPKLGWQPNGVDAALATA